MLIGRRNLIDGDVEVRVLDVFCAGSWRDFHWMDIWGDHCPLELLKSKESLSFLLHWSLKKSKSWLLSYSSLLYWHFENKNFSFYFGKFFLASGERVVWTKSGCLGRRAESWHSPAWGSSRSARWCPHPLMEGTMTQWIHRPKNTNWPCSDVFWSNFIMNYLPRLIILTTES